MPHASLSTPFGIYTLFEEGGALVAVEAGRAPDGDPPSALLAEAMRQLSLYFDGRLRDFSLPLAPAATPFQARVREALRTIPYGVTRSYRDLARDLGTAPRAVGTACARNPLPIVVPCHRVVGSTGHLTGFSAPGGIETKRALLRLEGAVPVDMLNPQGAHP